MTGLWVTAGVVALLAILGIGYLVMNGRSDGATTEAVPNVVQRRAATAKRILGAHGFHNVKVNTIKSDVTKGYVASTDPANGSQANPKDQILLNVSDGPGLASLPDITGQGVVEARQTLKNAGFSNVRIATKRVADTQYNNGQVVSASPAIGSMADPSQAVTLTLSNGKVHVPSGLVGQDAGAAQLAILQAHLKPSTVTVPVTDPDQGGKVQKVSPRPGAEVGKGATVTVTVGVFSSQTTVTVTPPPTHTSPPTSPTSPTTPPDTSPTTPPDTSPTPPSNTATLGGGAH
jgi:serine/threonine-protein kinase